MFEAESKLMKSSKGKWLSSETTDRVNQSKWWNLSEVNTF